MTTSDANRRSSIRKRPRGWLLAECRKRGTMGPNIAEVVWDVSQTGLCMVTNAELKVGQDLEVQITSTSLTQKLKTNGTVVWVDQLDSTKYSIGVRFEQMLPYQQICQLTI
ncbi:MAG: PilZ domain-containing protein [Planctomycetia bacterium]|nr:PilZ domain-containing protein [Planctomycetia bacterium]